MKKLKSIKPMFNKIVTTMDCYEQDQVVGGVIDTNKVKGSLKEYQTVVAVGSTVRDINVGDVVAINPTRYAVMKHDEKSMKNGIIGDNMRIGYKFNTVIMNNKEYLMLYDQDIDFVVLESEDIEDETGPVIIQPEKPSIIV